MLKKLIVLVWYQWAILVRWRCDHPDHHLLHPFHHAQDARTGGKDLPPSHQGPVRVSDSPGILHLRVLDQSDCDDVPHHRRYRCPQQVAIADVSSLLMMFVRWFALTYFPDLSVLS